MDGIKNEIQEFFEGLLMGVGFHLVLVLIIFCGVYVFHYQSQTSICRFGSDSHLVDYRRASRRIFNVNYPQVIHL